MYAVWFLTVCCRALVHQKDVSMHLPADIGWYTHKQAHTLVHTHKHTHKQAHTCSLYDATVKGGGKHTSQTTAYCAIHSIPTSQVTTLTSTPPGNTPPMWGPCFEAQKMPLCLIGEEVTSYWRYWLACQTVGRGR